MTDVLLLVIMLKFFYLEPYLSVKVQTFGAFSALKFSLSISKSKNLFAFVILSRNIELCF